MKSKNMKKVLSVAMSATMVMGMSMTAFAEDPTPTPAAADAEVEAPIYSLDITQVIVPTTYAVAFNPDELTVTVDKTNDVNSTDPIVSKKYGIINKSTKDKIVSVELQVEDLNTGDNHVTFVDTAAEATGADAGKYAVYLAATPADATEVKIGSASADKDTEAADLANVTMSEATGKDVAMHSGSNHIAFKLAKAEYELKTDGSLELGTATNNDVKDLYQVKALAGSGAGITGFTFTGAMNKNADWNKLQNKIKISAIYTSKNASTTDAVITGTGAMVQAANAPTFSSNVVGEITYTAGVGDLAFKEFKSISALWQNSPLDITSSTSVDTSNSKITIASSILSGWAKNGENPIATITYENQGGQETTGTVTLKTH